MTSRLCPCGRTKAKGQAVALSACCGSVHAGEAAADAERLMRSRYSAFVLGDIAYLLRTWHPSTRPASVEIEADAQWLGLDIRHHVITGEHSAEVEFVARFRVGGRAVRQHECSRFVREDGRWFYVNGDVR